MTQVEAKCPIRPGEPCSLCYPGATGPQDCGLVWIVSNDPELAAEWARNRREEAARKRAARAALKTRPEKLAALAG